jgi:hypothetical protein
MTETVSTVQTLDVTAIDNSSEHELTNEVAGLWLSHNETKTSLHHTRDELKRIRTDLSQKLYDLKAVLSRPGRGGAWSSFLVSQDIPRSSADRLVRGHAKTISTDPDSCSGDQIIPETNEVVVHRYARAIWPKLSRILNTRESVQLFTSELHRISEKSFSDMRSVSSAARSSGIPSYLMNLGLPVIAVSGDAAHG